MRGFTKSRSILSALYHNSSPIHSDTQKADTFNNYFLFCFNKTFQELPPSFDLFSPESLCQVTITEADVYDALVKLDTSKAMGPDGMPPIVLSRCASALYIYLSTIF